MFKSLLKNKFINNVLTLVGGTLGAQLIAILAAPIITRLYSPESFGIAAVFASILAIWVSIASLRYEQAIPVASNEIEAINLAALSFSIVIFNSLCCAILIYLIGEDILKVLDASQISPFLWLIPVGVFAFGSYQVLSYLAIRRKLFKVIAKTKIKQALISLIIQLFGSSYQVLSLLVSQVFNQAAGVLTLRKETVFKSVTVKVKPKIMILVAKKYYRFPLFDSWSALFSTVGGQLPPILFAALFSPAIAGIYALANRVLALPMTILGSAITNVFFSKTSEMQQKGELGAFVASIHSKLANIAAPLTIILILTGPQLFSFVFGANWVQAGEFSKWMAFWLYWVFTTSPLSSVYAVTDGQKQTAIFQFCLFTVRLLSIFLGYYEGDAVTAVAYFSLSSAFCWICYFFWINKIVKNPPFIIISTFIKAFSSGALLTSPLILVNLLGLVESYLVISLILSTVLISFSYFMMLKKQAN